VAGSFLLGDLPSCDLHQTGYRTLPNMLLLLAVAGASLQILRTMDAPFETVNILENEALRTGMKEYSQWPT
jgi:glutaredoxin-related protein